MLQNLNQIVENLAGSSIYTWLFAKKVGLGLNFLLFKGLIQRKRFSPVMAEMTY